MLRILLLLTSLTLGMGQDDTGIDVDMTCATCHVGGDWLADAGANFDHLQTGFELTGTHSDLTCAACHPGSTPQEKHEFGNVDPDCASCHEDVHDDQWGQDCQRCHETESWVVSSQDQNHDLTRFPLTGIHKDLSCETCHLDNPSGGPLLAIDCAGCHAADYGNASNPDHSQLALGLDCEACHAAESRNWTDSHFDHFQTGFALIGLHETADCGQCHAGEASQAEPLCESCHLSNYTASLEPAHASLGYPQDCAQCHTPFNWRSDFSHDQTLFPLQGAHEPALCSDCHGNGQFAGLPSDCADCHRVQWVDATEPSHDAAEFPESCEDCHTSTAWTPANWDHDTDTSYPLTGAHMDASCINCHLTAPYADQDEACQACHIADYDATVEPDHAEANIPVECEVCHSTTDWETEEINHDLTDFPIVGAHIELSCESCHDVGYDIEPLCESCHLPEYEATAEGNGPDHSEFEFDEDCSLCHGQDEWLPSFYDHDANSTGYEIKGAHLDLLPSNCVDCHVDYQWSDIPSACENCHQASYQETSEPDHSSEGYPDNLCENCHSESAWVPHRFEHDVPELACLDCHTNQYTATSEPDHDSEGYPSNLCANCHGVNAWAPHQFGHDVPEVACIDCHGNQYSATTNPDHASEGYPENICASCHGVSSWTPDIYEHDLVEIACVDCHTNQYEQAADPDHQVLEFPQTCEDCHSSSAWRPSSFDHDIETTGFLLDGSHLGIGCNLCHSNWEPPTEVRTCASASCHADNYSASSNPPHELVSFGNDCQECHTTQSWAPSSFSHDLTNTGFALNGAHQTTECSQCHSPWQVLPEPRSCAASSCHLTDYQNVTNPNHASAGFPLTCEDCHSEIAWDPSTFDHDGEYFPIYSGQHNNEWDDCSQCHINSNDFADFTCFGAGCHNVNEMNNEHCEDEGCETCNGQTYPISGVTPEDCLSCHPNGDEDDCEGRFRDIRRLFPRSFPSIKDPHAAD